MAAGLSILVLSMPSVAQPVSAESPKADPIEQLLNEQSVIARLGEQTLAAGQAFRTIASDLVFNALGMLGVPYKRGGNTAEEGLDCSGFVRLVYSQTAGMLLPRRSAEQAAATQPIAQQDLRPGDLVFFNTLRAAFSHVGIYVGDNKFVHAPRTGAVVRVEDMTIPYWKTRFEGARRVALPQSSTNDSASQR